VHIRARLLILAGVGLIGGARVTAGDIKAISFFENRDGPEVSLTAHAPVVRGATVTFDGGDSRRPSTPFMFDWGDGSRSEAFGVTSRAYREYVEKSCPYATIQSGVPGEPDRTFGTFMTVAYEFVRLADERHDFRKPLQRMMAFLQTFNEQDHRRFQARETEAFRGTLMVAALSYGFNTDVRPTFRHLRFPVDDSIYRELIGRMPGRVNFIL
jgi:hypothetical protein